MEVTMRDAIFYEPNGGPIFLDLKSRASLRREPTSELIDDLLRMTDAHTNDWPLPLMKSTINELAWRHRGWRARLKELQLWAIQSIWPSYEPPAPIWNTEDG